MLQWGSDGVVGSNGQELTLIYLLIGIVIGLVLSEAGESRPLYLEDLPQKLKKCLVCHTTRSGPHLNAFGVDYEKAGLVNPLELDSDQDGYTNEQELKAGTSPGNPHDFPGHQRFPWGWIAALLLVSLGILIAVKKRNS